MESTSSPSSAHDRSSVFLDGKEYPVLPIGVPFTFERHRRFLDGLFSRAVFDDIGEDVVIRIKLKKWNDMMDQYNDEFIRQMFL